MASTLPARTASNALRRHLASRSNPLMESAASSCSSSHHNIISSQSRSISSISGPTISPSIPKSSLAPPTYSAFRNKVTMPFDVVEGQPYTSPYSEFFANIDAGRTTLGTTEEMEQQVAEIQEQKLDCGIAESHLRFTTTSYGRYALPPYVAPGEHRVTVKVALEAIPFENEQEKDIFLEVVGSRFDPKKGDLQLSSEKFASRIENKRHLVDMIERLVSNAQRLAKEFADEKTGNAQ